jgi:hypothetical protein
VAAAGALHPALRPAVAAGVPHPVRLLVHPPVVLRPVVAAAGALHPALHPAVAAGVPHPVRPLVVRLPAAVGVLLVLRPAVRLRVVAVGVLVHPLVVRLPAAVTARPVLHPAAVTVPLPAALRLVADTALRLVADTALRPAVMVLRARPVATVRRDRAALRAHSAAVSLLPLPDSIRPRRRQARVRRGRRARRSASAGTP